jgi:membrane fusion protein (multidrug efflux system)
MVKRFAIALLAVVLVCGGLVGFNIFRSKMIADFFANQQMPTATVSATKIEPTTWTPEIDALGTVWAFQGVDVAAEAAGVVRAINFHANEVVGKGELLVQLDDSVERADLLAARATVERDEAQLKRAQSLRKSGVSSEATLEEAQTALAASQSNLARIQAVIDHKAIEAPFAGTVGIPRIDLGQYVQPGAVLATLQQMDTMKVDFTVPEQRVGDLRIGQPATFGLTEAEFPYKGRIIGIDPKIDPQTRMAAVRAELENPDGELRPGQFVRVRVALPAKHDVIALPQTSVVTSLYGDYVYLVEPAEEQTTPAEPATGEAASEESGEAAKETPPAGVLAETEGPKLVAKQVFVKVGRRQGNLIEVTEGLKPGQTVVTSGQNKLANNMPVAIDNRVDPAAVALGDGDGAT